MPYKDPEKARASNRESSRRRRAADPEQVRAAARRYRDAHPEQAREAQRRYRDAHPERAREQSRRWRASHPQEAAKACATMNQQWAALPREERLRRSRAFSRRWRERRPKASRAKDRRYAETHPAVIRAKTRRRRALKANAYREPINIAAIYARDGGTCHLCQKAVSEAQASLDHLTPLALGGDDTPINVRISHLDCNVRRQHRGPAQLLML